MSTTHKKIIKELIRDYKKNKSTLAITIFGSVARGEERPDSDIDLSIFTKTGKTWKLLKKKKEGIEIDLVICPKNHLKYQVGKYPYLCYDYLNEKIVYDPERFMRGVHNNLKQYFKKHPEIVRFWQAKLKIMKENKARGQDPKDAVSSYDEAEILFSKQHKITRDFFRV